MIGIHQDIAVTHGFGKEIVGIDVSTTAIEFATRQFGRSGLTFRTFSADVGFAGLGTFDVVVSSFAIHHLPHSRKKALYREAWWANRRHNDPHSYVADAIPLGDFNLPKAVHGDPVYDALTYRGLAIPANATIK